MSLTYLGSPFSHDNDKIRELNYKAVLIATQFLIFKGVDVYSPIVHNYQIERFMQVQTASGIWRKHNKAFIRMSKEFRILTLPRWEKSIGLKDERKFANLIDVPIFQIDPRRLNVPEELICQLRNLHEESEN